MDEVYHPEEVQIHVVLIRAYLGREEHRWFAHSSTANYELDGSVLVLGLDQNLLDLAAVDLRDVANDIVYQWD